MFDCQSYEGSYVLQTPLGAKVQLRVECTSPITFWVGDKSYAGDVNEEGQLEVNELGLYASITGTAPDRYLFGVADFVSSSSTPEWDADGKPEPWGAEEGMVTLS